MKDIPFPTMTNAFKSIIADHLPYFALIGAAIRAPDMRPIAEEVYIILCLYSIVSSGHSCNLA
jgi:hypothetical protein